MKPSEQAKRAQETLKLLKPKKRNEILSRILGENIEIENPKSLMVTFKNGKYKIENKKDKRFSLEISKELMPKLMKRIEKETLSGQQIESLSQKNPAIYRRENFAVTLETELANNENLLKSMLTKYNQVNISSLENIKVKYDTKNDNYKISGMSSDGQKVKIQIPRSALKKFVADDLAKQLLVAMKDLSPESVGMLIKTKEEPSVQGTINNVRYDQKMGRFEVSITTFPKNENSKFSIGDMADVRNLIVNAQKVAQSQRQAMSTDYPAKAAYSTTMEGQPRIPEQQASSINLGTYPPAAYGSSMEGQPLTSEKAVSLGNYPPAPYSTSMESTVSAHDLPDVPTRGPLNRQQYDALSPGEKLVIETVDWDRELKLQNNSLRKLSPQALLTLLTSKGYIDAQGYDVVDSKTVSVQYNEIDNKLILTGNFKAKADNSYTTISTDIQVERYYEFKADLRKALAEKNLPKAEAQQASLATPPTTASLPVAARAAALLATQKAAAPPQENYQKLPQRSAIFSQTPDALAQKFLGQLKSGLLSSIVSDYNKREKTNYNLRTSDLSVVYDSDKDQFKITGKSFYRGQDRTMWLSADEVNNAKINLVKPANEAQNTNVNAPVPIVGAYVSTAPIKAVEAAQQPYAQAPNYEQLQIGQDNVYSSSGLPKQVPQDAQYAVPEITNDPANGYGETNLPDEATHEYAGVGEDTEQRKPAAGIEPAEAPSKPYQEFSQETNINRYGKFQEGASASREKRPAVIAHAAASTRATATPLAAAASSAASPTHEQARQHKPGEGPAKPGGKPSW